MFSILDEATIGAAVATREEEVRRLLTQREARRQTGGRAPRTWRWSVEPGKEEEFEHLRGWYLSSLGDSHAGVAAGGRQTYASPTQPVRAVSASSLSSRCHRSHAASRKRLPLLRASAFLAGRAFLGAGRRLVEWGGEPL